MDMQGAALGLQHSSPVARKTRRSKPTDYICNVHVRILHSDMTCTSLVHPFSFCFTPVQ
jgi:hypothetical protein